MLKFDTCIRLILIMINKEVLKIKLYDVVSYMRVVVVYGNIIMLRDYI